MRESILMFLIAASLVIGFPLAAAGTARAETTCVGDELACAKFCMDGDPTCLQVCVDDLACVKVCEDPESLCVVIQIRPCVPVPLLGCIPQNSCLPFCMGGGGSVKPPTGLEVIQ